MPVVTGYWEVVTPSQPNYIKLSGTLPELAANRVREFQSLEIEMINLEATNIALNKDGLIFVSPFKLQTIDYNLVYSDGVIVHEQLPKAWKPANNGTAVEPNTSVPVTNPLLPDPQTSSIFLNEIWGIFWSGPGAASAWELYMRYRLIYTERQARQNEIQNFLLENCVM